MSLFPKKKWSTPLKTDAFPFSESSNIDGNHNITYACLKQTAADWACSHGRMCSAVTTVMW